jgi:hypothetical protein
VEGDGSTRPTLPHRLGGWPIPRRDRYRSQYGVSVNEDCRHYVMKTTHHEEKLERCTVGANEPIPFACPEGCLFYEPRKVSGAGWTIRSDDN